MTTQPRKFYEAEDYGSNSLPSKDGTIIEFLLGSHSYEGVWIGEKHPTRPGTFWWRPILREYLVKQSQPPISSGQQGGDMTARDFFDSPESAITLDLICNPTEKEFLLDMIELYAKGKVLQSLPTPAPEENETTEAWTWVAIFYSALNELVELKTLKETLYKGNPDGKEYAERKPMAWHMAKEAVELWKKSDYGAKPLPKPAAEGMGEAVKEAITNAHMAGQNSAGCKEPSFSEALAYYQSIQTSSVK